MKILALTGPKTCGKDTMSKLLYIHKPYFIHAPFARGPKTICHQVFGWGFEEMERFDFKETVLEEWPHVEPRWPMMDIANWFRDKYGPEVWVNVNYNRIKEMERTVPNGNYVITDLRFPNELEWVKRMGGMVVYIYRTEAEEALADAKAAGDEKALNQSEAHYDLLIKEADIILNNNKTIQEGQQTLLHLAQAFVEGKKNVN